MVRALRGKLLELFQHVDAGMGIIHVIHRGGLVIFQRHTAIIAAFNDTERATGYACPAAIAHVILHYHSAKFGAKQCAGRTDIKATCMRAVLADIRGHQPPEGIGIWRSGINFLRLRPDRRHAQRNELLSLLAGVLDTVIILFHEGHVPPSISAQRTGVVIGITGDVIAFYRIAVPLLARHLAGLTTNTNGGIGKKGHAAVLIVAVPARVLGQ